VSEVNSISGKLNSFCPMMRMEMVLEALVYFITDENDP